MPSKTQVLVHLGNTPRPACVDSDQLFKMFSPAVLENALWFETIKTADSVTTAVLHLRFRILGGKGGFGSQLRAQGNKMSSKKRAGDYSCCRDLTGRRIRTTEQNQKIEEHLRAVTEYHGSCRQKEKQGRDDAEGGVLKAGQRFRIQAPREHRNDRIHCHRVIYKQAKDTGM